MLVVRSWKVEAGLNKSDTGDSSERVTPREIVVVILVSPDHGVSSRWFIAVSGVTTSELALAIDTVGSNTELTNLEEVV